MDLAGGSWARGGHRQHPISFRCSIARDPADGAHPRKAVQ